MFRSGKGCSVYIDGSIGAGKSTALRYLQEHGYHVSLEPVNVWMPYLDELYKEGGKSAFEFQVKVWYDRCLTRKTAGQGEILIHERSPAFQKNAFLGTLHESGLITERQRNTLRSMYETIDQQDNINDEMKAYIYLRCSPETCRERQKARSRNSEESIEMDYLIKLHDQHEKAYMECVMAREGPVLCIDVNDISPEETAQKIIEFINKL